MWLIDFASHISERIPLRKLAAYYASEIPDDRYER